MKISGILLSLNLLVLALTSTASEYYVSPTGTGDATSPSTPGSLGVTLHSRAAAGDTIHLTAGDYDLSKESPDGWSASHLHPTVKNVGLIGGSADPSQTRLIGNNTTRIVYFDSAGAGLSLRNLTLMNGYTTYQGAGVCGNKVAYTASNVVVSTCSADYQGGGAYCGTWIDCVFTNCEVRSRSRSVVNGYGGGAFGGTYRGCLFVGNRSTVFGGALGGSGNLVDSKWWRVQAFDCVFSNNVAEIGGGAVASVTNEPMGCFLSECLLVTNVAMNGGGAVHVALEKCTLRENFASGVNREGTRGHGGGAWGCLLTNCTVRANTGIAGGGIFGGTATNTLLVANIATINSGSATYAGGGAAYATLIDCRVIANTNANSLGGGTMECTNIACFLSGNYAQYGGAFFGGCCIDSTICSNDCKSLGAAGFKGDTVRCRVFDNLGTKNTLDCGVHIGDLVYGNQGSGLGQNYGEVVAVNCTIADNLLDGVTAGTMTNCLVYGNRVDVKNLASASHSAWETGTGPVEAPGCLPGVAPKFVVAPGPDQCPYSLQPGSPLVNKALALDDLVGAFDILGNARVFDGRMDIGACEAWWERGLLLIFK